MKAWKLREPMIHDDCGQPFWTPAAYASHILSCRPQATSSRRVPPWMVKPQAAKKTAIADLPKRCACCQLDLFLGGHVHPWNGLPG